MFSFQLTLLMLVHGVCSSDFSSASDSFYAQRAQHLQALRAQQLSLSELHPPSLVRRRPVSAHGEVLAQHESPPMSSEEVPATRLNVRAWPEGLAETSQGLLVDIAGLPTDGDLVHPFWLFQWDLIFKPEVAICCTILFFSAILCSAAGIGGGGIYVAALMVCGKLTPHDAVPLSKAIVFFGSMASLVVNLYQQALANKKPEGKKVIDVDAMRVVVPATLIGTFLGVLLNRHTSDYVIVVLLTSLLGFMTGMVLRTARQQVAEEALADTAQAGASDTAASSGEQPAPPPQGSPNRNTPLLLGQQKKQVLSSRDGNMGAALLVLVVMGGILRFHMGACRAEVMGDTSMAGSCNHPVNLMFRHHMENWMKSDVISKVAQMLVVAVPMWTCIAGTVHFGFVANRDVGWEPRSVMLYQAVSVATGLLAGLVGVGGGLILAPFFLLTGMDPAVAVSTSATCVLFTSSSTTLQYLFTDRVIMSLALMYGIVTLVASFLGTCLVHVIQDKFARKSYITFIVALGVGISAVLSVIKFVYLVSQPEAPMAHAL